MNRQVLFVKVAAVHLLIIGLLFGVMNGCERKRQSVDRLPQVADPPPEVKREEILEKEETLVIREYGRPGAVKASEIEDEAKVGVGGDMRIHEVEKGDTISGIAQEYGVSLKAVMELNDMKNLDAAAKIKIGQKIKIPGE